MSIPRYTVTGDGLQDDPHGFLARWYDCERLQAEVERLTRERAQIDEWVAQDKASNERIAREMDELRAQRDGLAKALATIAQDQDSGWPEDGPGERVPLHEADDMMAMARAALAALPPKEDEHA